jgi:2,3-bisphosphoglycerate-independent phosphoglycerate mutase
MKNKNILNKKVLLIILDGFGINKNYKGNAITKANMPFYSSLLKKYPNTKLGASEEFVGLPHNQIGTSEVGHSTIGAGRVLVSEISHINNMIKSGDFKNNKILINNFKKIKDKNTLHLVGLVSDGGVHSHIDHLFYLLDIIKEYKNIKKVYIHVFSDGRDTKPQSAIKYIRQLQTKLNEIKIAEIASISGRYYAMDRDNNWDRLKKVYNILVYNKGNYSESITNYVINSYNKGITDEFFEPTYFIKNCNIKQKDTVLFFNFRSDRAREFTKAFCTKYFSKFKTEKLNINFITFTQYDSKIKNVKVLFPPEKKLPGLGQIISKLGYKQLRIAESEKYAHVTYFFNIGQEKPNKNENRILISSPSVATYDLKPEMSAKIITKELISTFNKNYILTVLNFANPDMVGHTGNIKATISALETIDKCLSIIFSKIDLNITNVIITADHGNCDEMIFEDNTTSTSHSLNKVPFILINNNYNNNNNIIELKKDANLSIANIAPTILDLLELDIPSYMCESLIKKEDKLK